MIMDMYTILASFLPTWLIFIVACISPGQNTVLMMSTGLGNTKAKTVLVASGLGIGGFTWSFISLLGITILLKQYPYLIKIIALIGGLYLMYLGIKTLMSTLNKNEKQETTASKLNFQSNFSALKIGLVTTFLNPKVALLWISLSPMIPIKTNEIGLLSFYSIVIALIVFGIYGSIGLLFSSKKTQAIYSNNAKLFNIIFGSLFSLLGFGLIFNHVLL